MLMCHSEKNPLLHSHDTHTAYMVNPLGYLYVLMDVSYIFKTLNAFGMDMVFTKHVSGLFVIKYPWLIIEHHCSSLGVWISQGHTHALSPLWDHS